MRWGVVAAKCPRGRFSRRSRKTPLLARKVRQSTDVKLLFFDNMRATSFSIDRPRNCRLKSLSLAILLSNQTYVLNRGNGKLCVGLEVG